MGTLLDLLGGWQVKAAIFLAICAGLFGWHYVEKEKAVTKATTEYKEKVKDLEGTVSMFNEVSRVIKLDQARNAEAERKSNERKQKDEVSRLTADFELNRLLDTIKRTGSSSTDSTCPIGVCATTRELLGVCSQEYTKMAEAATRHAREVKELVDKWPPPDSCSIKR